MATRSGSLAHSPLSEKYLQASNNRHLLFVLASGPGKADVILSSRSRALIQEVTERSSQERTVLNSGHCHVKEVRAWRPAAFEHKFSYILSGSLFAHAFEFWVQDAWCESGPARKLYIKVRVTDRGRVEVSLPSFPTSHCLSHRSLCRCPMSAVVRWQEARTSCRTARWVSLLGNF